MIIVIHAVNFEFFNLGQGSGSEVQVFDSEWNCLYCFHYQSLDRFYKISVGVRMKRFCAELLAAFRRVEIFSRAAIFSRTAIFSRAEICSSRGRWIWGWESSFSGLLDSPCSCSIGLRTVPVSDSSETLAWPWVVAWASRN